MRPSRREILAGAGAGVVAGCKSVEHDVGSGDSATDPSGSTSVKPAIEHVIVVMMENRSFDHMFGALKLEEGREVEGLDADMSNPDADGNTVTVFHSEVECVPDPGHSWDNSHDQWNSGANDHFVTNYGDDEVMGYLNREDLPVYYALADRYALCDHWFCSVMGPTWPNRLYGHAGTSDGQDNNDLPADVFFTFPTVWTKLDEIGVGWRYYYTDLPFIALFEGHSREETVGDLDDFFWDLENGELPPVVWVDPGFSWCDDHPPHFVGFGQEWIAAVYSALAASPYWSKSLLVILYDEHGGFFDHVPPPTTDDDFAAEGFDQLGFRTPALVVGPYVKSGVSSIVFDHTSWIRFVCDLYGIEPWTRRIAAATSIGELIDWDKLAAGTPDDPIDIPLPEYDTTAFGEECEGQGVLGPPPPPADPAEAVRKSLEPWHALMRHLHREQDLSGKAPEMLRLIRRKHAEARARRAR